MGLAPAPSEQGGAAGNDELFVALSRASRSPGTDKNMSDLITIHSYCRTRFQSEVMAAADGRNKGISTHVAHADGPRSAYLLLLRPRYTARRTRKI